MLRNYLITALRNLVRNRLYAAINIGGLTVGFAAAFLIALFVRDEFSYDKFFPDYQHIYLMGSEISTPGRAKDYADVTPIEIAPLLRNDFPWVQSIARVAPEHLIITRGNLESTELVTWADPNIFDIFKFKVVAGSLSGALREPNEIVLTRTIAQKYFGRDNPIGQTLEFRPGPAGPAVREKFKRDIFRVAAVIADLPSNSSLENGILASGKNVNSTVAQLDNRPPGQDSWLVGSVIYLKLANVAAVDRMQSGLVDFMKRHKPGHASPRNNLYVKLILRPIASLHFAPGGTLTFTRGNINIIYAMAAIGLLIVLSAGINFVNLMTARAARRAVEVGVRKVTGAARRNLILQFIGEALWYVAVAVVFAIIVTAILLPSLNRFLDRTIQLGFLSDLRSVGFILTFGLVVGVLAGAYPALVLASFRPALVLKGAVGQKSTSALVRQSLVVFQFSVLIGLLIVVAVIYRQTRFAFNEARRLDTDQVVLILGAQCRGAFKEALTAISGVRGIACSNADAAGWNQHLAPVRAKNGTFITIGNADAGFGFFEFYGLKPIAGRFFSQDHPGDVYSEGEHSAPGAVVLNEAAVRVLGFSSPQDAIGQTTAYDEKNPVPSEIIGVVPDFAMDAVHRVVPPIAYFTAPDMAPVLNVRIDGARITETLEAIDKLWKRIGPQGPIDRQFLDQRIAAFYEDITRQETLFAVFAAVAICIAVLGLFGMSASIAERRTKEIGIRKAMGASSRDIVRQLVWQFIKPVILANAIAWPVGYSVMSRWLSGFAYHVTLEIGLFVAATVLAIFIAVITVWGHARLVARTQPVAALRYE